MLLLLLFFFFLHEAKAKRQRRKQQHQDENQVPGRVLWRHDSAAASTKRKNERKHEECGGERKKERMSVRRKENITCVLPLVEKKGKCGSERTAVQHGSLESAFNLIGHHPARHTALQNAKKR